MQQKTYVRISKPGIAVSLLMATVIGVWASLSFLPVQASSGLGYEGEAEYNAWTLSELADHVFLPFVNSDPAWQWLTTAIIQNSNDETAQVTLHYYDTDGTLAAVVNDALPPYGSRSYVPGGIFRGSLVITSTQKIAVNVNETPLGNWTGDQLMSYRGVGSGEAMPIFLPVIEGYGYNSILAVQNLGIVPTSITLKFYNNLTGSIDYIYNDTVPPYSAHWYNTTTLPGFPYPLNGFVVIESSSQPIASVGHYIRPGFAAVAHNNRRLNQIAYNLALPNLIKGYGSSGMFIYNPSSNAATVRISLYNTQGVAVTAPRDIVLPAGAIFSSSFLSPDWGLPDEFQGSALIASDQPVGALAQTNWNVSPSTATGYSGVSNWETTVHVPYVRRVIDQVVTQINVQNVGSEHAAVYVTYYDAQGAIVGTEVAPAVPPAATQRFDQATNTSLSPTFTGSAIVTSTQPIAAVGFISCRQASQVTVDATAGATLVYTDTQGTSTNIEVPAGAVDEPTTLVYVPTTDITAPTGFVFAGRAFDLSAYQNDTFVPTLTFNIPVTVTLHYTDTDVTGIDETQLQLQTWDEQTSAWVDAACGAYDRHPAANWLAVPICHLSRFALFGTLPPATITKHVSPEGQVRYGDELIYTLVISGTPGTEIGVYDPLTSTTFVRFVEQPAGIQYADHAITGTMTITPTNQTTVSFVVRVGVPGTIGIYVDVSNAACIYQPEQTISMCEWSNTVTNQAYRPYSIFLPLVMRNQ